MSCNIVQGEPKVSSTAIAILIVFLFSCTINVTHADQEEPSFIGAMSCGTSTCHGARVESNYGNILRNEFTTWYEEDPHSQSYEALSSPLGQQIAKILELTPQMTLGVSVVM